MKRLLELFQLLELWDDIRTEAGLDDRQPCAVYPERTRDVPEPRNDMPLTEAQLAILARLTQTPN